MKFTATSSVALMVLFAIALVALSATAEDTPACCSDTSCADSTTYVDDYLIKNGKVSPTMAPIMCATFKGAPNMCVDPKTKAACPVNCEVCPPMPAPVAQMNSLLALYNATGGSAMHSRIAIVAGGRPILGGDPGWVTSANVKNAPLVYLQAETRTDPVTRETACFYVPNTTSVVGHVVVTVRRRHPPASRCPWGTTP